MKVEYDVVVAGAGLGGLTAAALLSSKGFSTLVVEKSPQIGGRFTNIPYNGFQLTTGAFHLIPHRRGVVRRVLRDELRSDVEFIDIPIAPFIKEGSALDYVFKLPSVYDSVFRFSMGLKLQETPLLETIKFLAKSLTAGGPSLPKGGCLSIIQALEKVVLDNKGTILKRASAKGITTQKREAFGVTTEMADGSVSLIKTSRVISDLGPKATLKILPNGPLKEDFKQRLCNIRTVEGIKINLESKKSTISKIIGEDAGVVFTPLCKRITGIAEPSSADPDLAPPGKSLLMTYQQLCSSDIETEIQIGKTDLKETIPNFKANCRIIAIQIFKGNWPVNHAHQGQDATQLTPIKGLYLVGDGAKPSGFVMAEGVVEGAKRVVKHVLES